LGKAKMKYLGVSAQKTRLVADQVRGLGVGEALHLLHFSDKRVARDLEKLMKSAVANVQQAHPGLDVDRLRVARLVVDEAPPLKRARNASMGRIYRVLKRSCHVTLDLDTATGR
jgi:large subunit ribosomal protein L22